MAKLINKFMKGGNKQIVEKTMFKAFKKIKIKTNLATQYFFLKFLIKFRPLLGFISKRFGKQFKKIPVPLYPRRQTIVSLQWLVMSIKVAQSSSFETRIISEFLDLHAGKKTAL
jgi:ribosomal protein S7